jgi:hypothetical protein
MIFASILNKCTSFSRTTAFDGLVDRVNEGRRPVPREHAVVLASLNDEPAVALTRHH